MWKKRRQNCTEADCRKLRMRPAIVTAVISAGVIGVGGYFFLNGGEKASSMAGEESMGASANYAGNAGADEAVGGRAEYTEEEENLLESQIGVNVDENKIMNVDVGAILAAEAEVAVSRAEAEALADEELGGAVEVVGTRLREEDGTGYWEVRAIKGGDVYQVWIEANTGGIFINQKV